MSAAQPRRSFRVRGLCCAEETAALRRELGPLVGGEERLTFDLLQGRMNVSGDEATPEAICQAVARTGMRAEPWAAEAPERPALDPRTLGTALAGGLILGALAAHASGGAGWLRALGLGGEAPVPALPRMLYGMAVLASGWPVVPKAWQALRRLRPDMNLLMVLAVLGAVGLGQWLEAATVSFLFALSLVLEGWSLGRARRAVQALLRLAPDRVHVVGGCSCACGSEDRPAAEVAQGTRFRVLPGERIPLDGRVVEGEGEADEAPLTGESLPVPKAPGAPLYAGTINGASVLVAESTRPASGTMLARIIRLVEEAQDRRAPVEQKVERFARIYTPLVLGLALAVAVLPPLLGLGSPSTWFYRALVLLVTGCPCALVISTPVSLVAGLARAARHGVLIKGGAFLEAPAHLRAVAFDKTGTLTGGRLQVAEYRAVDGTPAREVLALAAGLGAQSDHPAARAVLAQARAEGVVPVGIEGIRLLPGRGLEGGQGGALWLGSSRLAAERGAGSQDREGDPRTLVLLGQGDRVLGRFHLADALRPGAAKAVTDLRAQGIGHLAMLTGDRPEAAGPVAAATGLDAFQAGLLPEDKVRAVETLVAAHGQVAMVGDGVNDAPAMARAGLGIAMGAAGSDTALETADIALMRDDLSRLPWLVAHSRRTLAVIRQNIAFALGLKALFILLALAGHASLWAAIAADTGASLLVVANGLRLLGGTGRDLAA
ncbi:MAG TPA: cation-translocating P-type ATPase [Holophaga sp.]|nr:cation-translocating P-type ATPase [Holophaga sp.]